MTMQTVHMDGSGALKSVSLDHRQASGKACASCGRSDRPLTRVGQVVNGGEVAVCDEHKKAL